MSTIDELLAAARELVDRGTTPALQLAVARDGELLAFETFGAATDESRFCVFSATKPIVASAIWALIGDGLVLPEDRIRDWVPELAGPGWDAVTLEHVMLHTAGFPNAALEPALGADPTARRRAFAGWALEWEPGSRFEYHALSAHWVLADLIERVTGEDFREFIAARVCAPLGLPRLLGIPPADQDDIVTGVPIGERPADDDIDALALANDPDVRAAGVPGGGGLMTAETMARWYQAVLANPGGLWDHDVWRDATTNIRCTFPDPLMGVGANRSLGLVIAGDDGLHQFRYGMFGAGVSPVAYGHAGAFGQIAWADPATGLSFACFKSGCDYDMLNDAIGVLGLADLASRLG